MQGEDYFKKCLSDDDFAEEIALLDEDLMEDYLEEGMINPSAVARLIYEGKLYLCFYGEALNGMGAAALLDAIDSYAGNFFDHSQEKYDEHFGARAYKISMDEKKNRMTAPQACFPGPRIRGRGEGCLGRFLHQ